MIPPKCPRFWPRAPTPTEKEMIFIGIFETYLKIQTQDEKFSSLYGSVKCGRFEHREISKQTALHDADDMKHNCVNNRIFCVQTEMYEISIS